MGVFRDGGEGGAYVPLEDDGAVVASSERHDAALANIDKTAGNLRSWMSALSIVFFLIASGLLWASFLESLERGRREEVARMAELGSIPIVALFFTWFHIWLAIQMMFRPIDFWGIWQYKKTGIGIGWQGVVPRKSLKMAKMAFSCARPYLLGPRDWLTRVDPAVLMAKTQPMMTRIIRASLTSVGKRHFPSMLEGDGLSPAVEEELVASAVEKMQASFPLLWHDITEILCDKETGVDNDGMIVDVFTSNVELLNHFFLSMGAPEFRFIERCGAALGFVCGCVQLFAFQHLTPEGRFIFLPATGFFLGIVTNYMAIQMCFWPTFPHPVRVCGLHICNLQGLFLKRQKDVAVLYSKMLCDHFFEFNKIVAYLQTQPVVWGQLQAAYLAHTNLVLKQTMGSTMHWLAPVALGSQRFKAVEADLIGATAERIAEASDLHTVASRYIAVASDVMRANSEAMKKMPPDEFEDLLHPVFKEDEWILVLLGGVLGAVVGFAQVHFLSE